MTPENSTESRVSPFQSPIFIVGTLFAVIVVGLGIWLGVTAPGKQPPTPLVSTSDPGNQEVLGDPEQQLPEPTPQPGASTSVCGLIPGNQDVPFDGFETVPVPIGQQLTVPGVEGIGPGITEGISRCFAHSPTGAILAAANFITWTSSQQQLDESSRTLILEDSRSKVMIDQAIADWDGSSGSPFLIHGYSYDYQGENDALIVLAVSMFDYPGKYLGFPVPVTWAEGDWKVVVPATYSWGQYPITSMEHEGFIRWGE